MLILVWVVAIIFGNTVAQNWVLQDEYQGSTFFDRWTIFEENSENSKIVNSSTAEADGFIKIFSDGSAYMSVEQKTLIQPNSSRMSVEIHTVEQYSEGLFIVDLQHSPSGCGVWPAFWTAGQNWPTDGEIDIIEGVNNQHYDQITLHTGPTCTMQYEDPGSFTGIWMTGINGQNATNCYVNAPDQAVNQGCSINGNNPQTFGDGFNKIGGGIFATLWDPKTQITVWFFPRGNIPPDVQSYDPQPAIWGKPMAYFSLLASTCPGSNFVNQTVIFDIGLCSSWAGRTFKDMCPGLGDCDSYVDMHPEAMTEAYWRVNFLRVFQEK